MIFSKYAEYLLSQFVSRISIFHEILCKNRRIIRGFAPFLSWLVILLNHLVLSIQILELVYFNPFYPVIRETKSIKTLMAIFFVFQNKIGQHGRNMYIDGPDYLVNPEPAPFTPQNFLWVWKVVLFLSHCCCRIQPCPFQHWINNLNSPQGRQLF